MEIKEKQLIFETKTKPFKAPSSRGLNFKFIAVFAVVLFSIFGVQYVDTQSSAGCPLETAAGQTIGNQSCVINGDNPEVILQSSWERVCRTAGCNAEGPGEIIPQKYTLKLTVEDVGLLPGERYGVDWFVTGQATKTPLPQFKDQFQIEIKDVISVLTYFPQIVKIDALGTRTPIVTSNTVGLQIGQQAEEIADPPEKAGVLGFISDIFLAILGLFASLLYEIFSLVVKPILKTVLNIPVHTFEFAEVIIRPWAVIRNLMNIFFMLSLIAVSLATLFRLGEKWNYRDVLVKIVTMALLINFSLSIAQVILGIAQTFQNQFLPADSQALEALAYSLLVEPFNIASEAGGPGGLSDLVGAFVKFFFSLSAFMVFLAITAFAVVRIVALWLLLMTSPIAYAAYVLPVTAHYAKSWWKEFIRYAFLTPLLGLMLQICGVIAQSQAVYVARLSQQSQTFGDTLIYGVLSSAITIACLTFGLGAVTKGVALSGKIADKTTGWANRRGIQAGKGAWNFGVKRPVVNSKNAIKRGIQNKSARTLASSNAGGFKKFVAGSAIAATGGAGAYFKTKRDLREARNKDAQQKAEASARHYALLHATGIEDKEHIKAFSKADDENMARYKDMGKKDLLAAYQTLKSDTSERGRAQMRALLKSALDSGKLKNIVEAETGGPATEANINKVLNTSLEGDPEKDIFLNAFDDAAKKKGNVAYMGHNKGTSEERNAARVEWIKDLDDKEIANINTKGLNMKEHASVMSEAVKKITSQERIPTSQAVKTTFSTGMIHRESGKLIFESQDHADDFLELDRTNHAEALRLYNKLVGVEKEGDPGWQKTIPGYIIERQETDDAGAEVLVDGKPSGKKEYFNVEFAEGANGQRIERDAPVIRGDEAIKFKEGFRSAGQVSAQVQRDKKRDKRGGNDDEDEETDNAQAATPPPASPPPPRDPSHQNTTEPI